MVKRAGPRLHELNLPDDIVTIARTYGDLPPEARASVEAAIAQYWTEISTIEGRISGLVLPRDFYIRQDLREELGQAQLALRACEGLLSKIRCLPFETMGEIFAYYIAPGGKPPQYENEDDDDADEEAAEARFRQRHSAGLLCLVCQHWRTIAAGTPSLWSDIQVKVYHEVGGPSDTSPLVLPSHVRGLLAWMDRVTSHPWKLTRVDGEQADVQKPWLEKVRLDGAVPLAQLVHRRASAYITRLSVSSNHCAIDLGHLVCPRITSVVSFHPQGALAQTTLHGLPVMVNLERAVLWTTLPETLPANVPWSKLTHLALGGNIVVSQWKSIIRHCTSLQQGLFFLFRDPDNDDDDENVIYPTYPGPSEVVLQHLTHLVFNISTPFDAPIDGLFLPALTTLKVFTQWNESLFDAQPELFSNLTHLTLLQQSWVDGEDAVRSFSKMPQLTELLFRICGDFEQMFDFLTYGRDGKFNLRMLKALGIYIVAAGPRGERGDDEEDHWIPFPHQQIIDVIDSRTQAIRRGDFSASPYTLSPLGHFVLRLDADFDVDLEVNRQWTGSTVAALKDGLKSYESSCGLKASVFGTPPERYYDVLSFPDLFYLPGRPYNEKRLVHWDEGFMDPVGECEEYSLYPVST